MGCFLQLVRGVIFACCEVLGFLCLTQAGKAHDQKKTFEDATAKVFLAFKVVLFPSVTKKGLFGFLRFLFALYCDEEQTASMLVVTAVWTQIPKLEHFGSRNPPGYLAKELG